MNFYHFLIGMLVTGDVTSVMYHGLNEKIEKMSKILYILALNVSIPAAIIPPLIICVIDYMTDTLTDESFYLPFPVM